MQYISTYHSPFGEILLAADEIGIIGLWFEHQKFFASGLDSLVEEKETFILQQAKRWLDIYFSRTEPPFSLPFHLIGTTFQKEVWKILLTIPYGKTMTYGEIATKIAQEKNLSNMSAQAVGGAVRKNPISIMIPCHRVVGTKGALVGYASGLDKKLELLKLETSKK